MQDLLELLKANPYPGRGIVVGKDCVYYWIMGRSANSRNRVFVECEDGIRTEAHDPSKLEDPSLIIYHPVRTMGDKLVVTNGDQTDTIVEKGDFFAGCMAREYEPDAPNFTPRISACINPDGSFEMSILKHQFEQGGNPLPTFAGEPVLVSMPSPEEVWAALNPDNKVSLYTNVAGTITIFNKNLGD